MITIYDWFGYELPIKERYRLIKEAGFDGVLLWWSNGLLLFLFFTLVKIKCVCRLFR